MNTLINKLPVELHIPGYNFCGPGTKLQKRLLRGDKGINPLDEACKQHDIAYSQSKDIKSRHKADKLLAEKALNRFKSKDSTFGEKTAALGISGAMKVKTKLGMGLKKRKRLRKKGFGISARKRMKRVGRTKRIKRTRGNGISLRKAIFRASKGISGKKFKSLRASAKAALAAIKNQTIVPPKKRIIPVPKSGGFLPLIPLFAGLSALGALGGGAAGIAKAVNDAKAATQKLEEAKRHNQAMEAIALGKKGGGLYLKPYKTGCGLYLKPYSKNC